MFVEFWAADAGPAADMTTVFNTAVANYRAINN
jgi:hypothetical protein